jgi:excisionase family DNA binding protein
MKSERLTSTVTEFAKRSGISRSKVYEMLDSGELESAKIGGMRLILEESYRRLLEKNRIAPRPPA